MVGKLVQFVLLLSPVALSAEEENGVLQAGAMYLCAGE